MDPTNIACYAKKEEKNEHCGRVKMFVRRFFSDMG